jgi:hypothetical protein
MSMWNRCRVTIEEWEGGGEIFPSNACRTPKPVATHVDRKTPVSEELICPNGACCVEQMEALGLGFTGPELGLRRHSNLNGLSS